MTPGRRRRNGQKTGHACAEAGLPGIRRDDYLGALVAEHGSLAAVAWRLVGRGRAEDVSSVERALRRLRGRGQRDGGLVGQRLLRAFGLPAPLEARARWMGLYHSLFGDLPVQLCADQLRLWDRAHRVGSHPVIPITPLRPAGRLAEACGQTQNRGNALQGRNEPRLGPMGVPALL